MGEQELISLATTFLQTPKGKLLLGEEINISGITSQIQSLSQQYNINLEIAVSHVRHVRGASNYLAVRLKPLVFRLTMDSIYKTQLET